MTDRERTNFEMALQNFSAELKNLSQANHDFNDVDILVLESYEITLNQLINNKKSALIKARAFKQQLVG
ncbi:MAG: hypothetical protein CMF49_05070 [Legionellales bacterium]|nr:hypothetical protein [Legionellales bacterium]|tara:strand:- start:180 stop:386 length:207 start_codon:yes stop_codon:yes gene_type:complete